MKTKVFVLLGTLAVFVVLGTLGAPQASAQAVYGSIFGTITDPSGAAVAGAKVTVTSASKGTTFETTTNSDGNYSVTHLIPDLYNIRAEGSGFKAFEAKSISVSADAGSRVDGQFQVGGSTETVEVTSEAPQLTTDRADVATTFNDKYVQDVPILNRNFTSLQLMAPGSQKMVGWSHAATENPQGSQQIFTQGQHFSGTAFELDGTDNQDPILGIIVVNPNLDAVTEAKVSLQNYDAEFGKAVSSVVTAQTKSGSAINFTAAVSFSAARTRSRPAIHSRNSPGIPSPTASFRPSRWAQFGGTIGGAIIKDKLFFFGDYQGTRQTNGVSGTLTVPTSRAATSCNPATNATSATPGYCDLSEYLDGGRHWWRPGFRSHDRRSQYRRRPHGVCQQPDSDWRISPAAGKILAAFPAPQSGAVLNNLIGSGSGPFTQNSFDTRIDYTASSTINVFGRFSLDYFKLSGTGPVGCRGRAGQLVCSVWPEVPSPTTTVWLAALPRRSALRC